MKKVLVSLIMLVPLLTGCANVDTMLTINDDKSASVVTSVTYKGNLSSKTDNVAFLIDKNYKRFLDPFYKTETAYGDKLSTIIATKNVKDLSKSDLDLASLGFVSNLESKRFVEVKKSFILSSFNVDLTYDNKLAKELENDFGAIATSTPKSTINPEYYHAYADKKEVEAEDFNKEFVANMDEDTKRSILDFINEEEKSSTQTQDSVDYTNSFSIQVPSIASYNNADSISGNVYSWNLKKDEPTSIKLQYVQYSGFAISFVILLGVLLLVVFAGRILKHDAQKRMDNIDNIV